MRRIEILIASPGDVEPERKKVEEIFTRWNIRNSHVTLVPVKCESASVPALGDHPQHVLNKQLIKRCELLIAIFWSKLGSPTRNHLSGTVEEIHEFIGIKGGERVMLYFCCRAFPYAIDGKELTRLQEFKKEIQGQGLYHEYKELADFEEALYRHLDAKIQDLLENKLPLPILKPATQPVARDESADPRLQTLIDFGSGLKEIADRFSARMDEFNKIGGGSNDKYLDLGRHVFTSCAVSLDRFMASPRAPMNEADSLAIDKISKLLKRLAQGESTQYLKNFNSMWTEGSEIATDLQAQVVHLERSSTKLKAIK